MLPCSRFRRSLRPPLLLLPTTASSLPRHSQQDRARPTVRLIHVPDKKPVAGAVLFETKADMTPEGMADMSGKVTPVPADQPGLYRFQVETGMAGKWQLSLGAKVQGETGTVRGTVPFATAK